MRKTLYPSASAFCWGDAVQTEYESGCLRSILLSAHGIRTSPPKIYMEVGAAHEDAYEQQLKKDPKVTTYRREVPVKQAIPGHDEVTYSGRVDVLAEHEGVGTVIHETKGTISKNTRLSVIRKGKVKLNQLAQLVSYMIALEIPRGKLVVGYYERTEDGKWVACEGREFKVTLADDGAILVDREPSGFSVIDALRHRNKAAQVLADNSIGERPDRWNQSFGGPCTHCPFKSACDKYDKTDTQSTEVFLGYAREALASLPDRPEPEPTLYKAPGSGRQKKPGKTSARAKQADTETAK
jgi:hypothetical protein